MYLQLTYPYQLPVCKKPDVVMILYSTDAYTLRSILVPMALGALVPNFLTVLTTRSGIWTVGI